MEQGGGKVGTTKTMKSRFRGNSEHTLDAKGRLNFPSRYRDIVRQDGSDVLMVTPWKGECLRVYTFSGWEAFEDTLLSQTTDQPSMTAMIRSLVSRVAECNLDKQGRILLPASLRTEMKIEKEIVLNGMLNFAEIWSKDGWLVNEQKLKDNFQHFEESFSKMGMF